MVELEEGREVRLSLAVRDKRGIAQYKDGWFFTLVVGDRDGDVPLKAWLGRDEDAIRRVYDQIQVGDVVRIDGRVSTYRGQRELHTNEPPEPVPRTLVYPHRFIPASAVNPETGLNLLLERVRQVENPHLRRLLLHVYDDPTIRPKLLEAPAAKSHHHNTLGGLIEHLLGATRLGDALCDIHPELNRDLLVTGVLLHDIGKLREYSWDVSIDFTQEGRLLGHIPMGDELVAQATQSLPEFPKDLALHVRHLILSHHGKLEWGSAVEPRTAEAVALHHLEHLDAELNKALAAGRRIQEQGLTGGWDAQAKRWVELAPKPPAPAPADAEAQGPAAR